MEKANTKKVELLAPAGGYDSFVAAINAGADAVYMGLKNFNARTMTTNFTIEEYTRAIDYAHKRNVKVYLTLNTLMLDTEIKQALNMVYELYKVGLDAVIVQDLGIADLIHKIMPELSLHASTQMSVATIEQVKVLEKLGFERVVLARELSIDEIKEIARNTKLEIEVFVHGALCVSVSGQCLMSAMIGDRSANRGNCAGPCRKKYSLYTLDGKPVKKDRYLLSKKDIYSLDKTEELISAGIHSLKIEGRNRTPEYVAGVVRNYKEALDGGCIKDKENEVLQLFNRSGKSDGYLKGVRYKESISEHTPKNVGLVLGSVIDIKKQYIKVKLGEDISMHDGIEIVGESKASTIVTCIMDEQFNIVNKLVKAGNIVWIGDIKGVKKGDKVYKTSDSALNLELYNYAKLNLKRLEYNVQVSIKQNEVLKASARSITVNTEYVPETSRTSCVNYEKLKEAFSKTEDTSVKLNVTAEIEQGLFVPVSKLNELRKKLVEKLEEEKLVRREIKDIEKIIEDNLQVKSRDQKIRPNKNTLYVYKYSPKKDYTIYYFEKYNKRLDAIYFTPLDFKTHEQDILKYLDKCDVYFVIPNVTLKNTTKYINENLERLIKNGIKGVLLGNIGFIPLLNKLKEKYNIMVVADYSLNITNMYTANKLKELGIDKITPLFEDDNVDLEAIDNVLELELVEDMATVMTTRYCVIASFAKNAEKAGDCKAECSKNTYYLIDEYDKRYDILTDNMDCITKYVRNKRKYSEKNQEQYSVRHCVLN